MRAWLSREISINNLWSRFIAFVLIFQPTFFLIFYTVIGLFQRVIACYGLSYWIRFYLPKILPLYVFAFWLLVRKTENSKVRAAAKYLSWSAVGIAIFFLCATLLPYLSNGLPLVMQFGDNETFPWMSAAVFEWNAAFLGGFILFRRKTGDSVLSFVFTSMLITVGGMFYELPIYHVSAWNDGAYFDISFPFFISTEFLCTVFLMFILYVRKWKPEKWFCLTLILYIVHGLWYFNHPTIGYAGIFGEGHSDIFVWLPRAIGIAFLLSLPAGIRLYNGAKNKSLIQQQEQ
jgi:hypothetical protein